MINWLSSFVSSSSTSTDPANPPDYSQTQQIPPPPKVPPGWTVEWSTEYSKYYFISHSTGTSQWENPAETAAMFPGQIARQNQQAQTQQRQNQAQQIQEETLPEYKP